MKSPYTQRECHSEHCGCKVAHEQVYDYQSQSWNWKCYNCGKLTPVRTRKANVQENGMTPAQEKAIAMLREQMVRAYGHTDYEYKKWEVKPQDGFVSLLAEVGMKGDEGTMAAVYCRECRHVFIGLKGGLTLANAKDPTESKGLHNVLYAARSY